MRGLSDRRRILFLLAIMAVVAVITAAMSLWLLYQTALVEERSRLVETAQSQARLIEAVARFDAVYSRTDFPGGAGAATLSQITDAHERYQGFGETGEFTLARREADKIVFLLSHRHYDLDTPNPVPWESSLAEPMRRALSGRSGTVIGPDYRDVLVLAAYEPVAELDLGIVAKIDMAEVRRPFLRAAGLSGLGALLIITLGAVAIRWIGTPMVERLKAEAALKMSEEWLRLITNAVPAGISYFDREQRYRFANQKYESLLRLKPSELVGKTLEEAIGKKSYKVARQYAQRALSGQAASFENTLTAENGGKISIAVSYVPDIGADRTVKGFFALVQDITERKRAEEELRESEARYRALFELSPDAVYVHQNGRIIFANASTMSLLAASAANDIVDKPVLDFVTPEDHARVKGRISHTLTTGQATPLAEFKMIRLDGVLVDVAVTGRAIEWKGESAVLVVVRDVSEQKAKEREIRTLNEDLERRVEERTEELRAVQEALLRKERLAALGQLTGTVAHELRNPLGAIATTIYVIKHRCSEAGLDLARAMDRIDRSIKRCDTIITELLDFARARGLERKPTALDTWLSEVLKEQHIPEGITVKTNLQTDGAVVYIDPDALRRAMINVIDNACQAMADGNGEGEAMAEGELTVASRLNGERVEIEIMDTGPGIPEDILPQVLEPLFSTKSFGAGLGLPTVQRIMEEHGGGLEISSEEGRGTQIVLWLPPCNDSAEGPKE